MTTLAHVHRELDAIERAWSARDLQSIRRGGDLASRRMSPRRIHKASSADAILSTVLRRLGWTAAWRDETLTAAQRLELVEAVRQYGRAWLRHEAEQVFRVHGSERLRSISPALALHLRRFFDRAKGFIHEQIIAALAALMGDDLAAADLEQAERLSRVQDGYLDQFNADVAANPPRQLADPDAPPPPPGTPVPMSPAQFVARAEMYGNAAHQAAQKIQRAAIRRGDAGKTGRPHARWERRVLGNPKTEHCTDCPPLAAAGWQPLGTLPDIGDSECGGFCLCHFEYSESVARPALGPEKPKPRPRIEIELPAIEHPEGPLSPEQLAEILKGVKYKATVVLGRGLGLERAAEGNPYHDEKGHFTNPGGVGHAGPKQPGKHWARRQKRKKRERRKAMKEVPAAKRKPNATGKTTGGRKGVDTRIKLTKSDAPTIKDQARAERAKMTEKRSTASVQQYGEKNELVLIDKLGGTQGTDNGAIDVVRRMGGKEHGIEVKTIVNKAGPNKSGSKAQIKCEKDQKARKETWKSLAPDRELHTVVFDHRDRAVDAGGNFIGVKEAWSGHDLYYRRGVGPYTLGGMHKVSSYSELKSLMAADVADLPAKARPPENKGEAAKQGDAAAKPKVKAKAKP